jgi:hypothetical protein
MHSTSMASRSLRTSLQPITLTWSHYVTLTAVMLSLAAILAAILAPQLSEALYRSEVLRYQEVLGVRIGPIRGWAWAPDVAIDGFTHVTPGGPMARAGARVGDGVHTHHGTGYSALLWAVREAIAGRPGCVDVINVADDKAYNQPREICLTRVPPLPARKRP